MDHQYTGEGGAGLGEPHTTALGTPTPHSQLRIAVKELARNRRRNYPDDIGAHLSRSHPSPPGACRMPPALDKSTRLK
eukprot:3265380-Prymnesium_polylepis.1